MNLCHLPARFYEFHSACFFETFFRKGMEPKGAAPHPFADFLPYSHPHVTASASLSWARTAPRTLGSCSSVCARAGPRTTGFLV